MHKFYEPRYSGPMNSSYYEILEVSPFSAQHEITQAYEKCKITYSSDNPALYTMFSTDEARELLKMVEEAYSVLGNKSLRALYDEKIGQKQKAEVGVDNLKTEILAKDPLPKKSAPIKPSFTPNEEMEEFIRSNSNWGGDELKKIREYKNFSLQNISDTTKITAFYVQAIEEMTKENLPAAVFVRGYVAQISKVLGLDERKTAESYMKIFKSL